MNEYETGQFLAALDVQILVLCCEQEALDCYIRLTNDEWAHSRRAVLLGTLDRLKVKRALIAGG